EPATPFAGLLRERTASVWRPGHPVLSMPAPTRGAMRLSMPAIAGWLAAAAVLLVTVGAALSTLLHSRSTEGSGEEMALEPKPAEAPPPSPIAVTLAPMPPSPTAVALGPTPTAPAPDAPPRKKRAALREAHRIGYLTVDA